MVKFSISKLILTVLILEQCSAYRLMSTVSHYIIEKTRQEAAKAKHSNNELRFHLQEVVRDAFSDAVESTNFEAYHDGVAESNHKIVLLGNRMREPDISRICGQLMNKELFGVETTYREGVHFQPMRPIPVPVTNLTLQIPSRWFREERVRLPPIFICYEGDTFLKLVRLETSPEEWGNIGRFRKVYIENNYNDRCRIREILVVLDDYWNNRNLFPKNLQARVLIESDSILPRATFTKECDPTLGIDQECCLWKFKFEANNGKTREFRRCVGRIPAEAIKSSLVPDYLAQLLTRGKMTRRFLAPPSRVCREIAFKPMLVRKPDDNLVTMDRLDAVECGAIY